MPTIQTWNPSTNMYEEAAQTYIGGSAGSGSGGFSMYSFGSPTTQSPASGGGGTAGGYASGGGLGGGYAQPAAERSFAMPAVPMAPAREQAAALPASIAPPTAGAAVAAPSISQYGYNNNYPTYLRNLGENAAQRSFQNQVNQGVRLGNSVQGYQQALNDRNNNRLQYMSQAGQADFGIQQAQAAAQTQYQQQLAALYSTTVQEKAEAERIKAQNYSTATQGRGQDLGYMSNVLGSNTTQRGQDMSLLGLGYQGALTGRGQDIGLYGQQLDNATRLQIAQMGGGGGRSQAISGGMYGGGVEKQAGQFIGLGGGPGASRYTNNSGGYSGGYSGQQYMTGSGGQQFPISKINR